MKEIPASPQTHYQASFPDDNVRATKDLILQSLVNGGRYNLIDVRSPHEFTGKVIAPPGMSETARVLPQPIQAAGIHALRARDW